MTVCGVGLQARGEQVALPDRRPQPASVWIKADPCTPRIPRDTPRFTALRRRAAVEREFGRLKNERALSPPRVRGVERVRLQADVTILAKAA